jgi:hypothetical protein
MNGLKAQYKIEGHQLLEAAIDNILKKKPRLRKKMNLSQSQSQSQRWRVLRKRP